METNLKKIANHQGQDILEATLKSASGVEVSIMSYGGIVRDWKVPVKRSPRSVVLGFHDFEAYLNDTAHIGALVGRVANRISGAEFSIEGRRYQADANVGQDMLHGGQSGLGRRNWKLAIGNSGEAVLRYHSPAGEMGFPGDVDFTAVYTLLDHRLRLEMSAAVSETTPINMVQHHYFNLMGRGIVLDHRVQIFADSYTPLSERLIPTGEIRSVSGSHFDLREGRILRTEEGLPQTYDVNYALNVENRRQNPVAVVNAPDNSLTLKLWTDQPGLQFYTSEYLDTVDRGLDGEKYGKYGGLCLEDQMFPDALHHSHFPSILVDPKNPYKHWCEIEIK